MFTALFFGKFGRSFLWRFLKFFRTVGVIWSYFQVFRGEPLAAPDGVIWRQFCFSGRSPSDVEAEAVEARNFGRKRKWSEMCRFRFRAIMCIRYLGGELFGSIFAVFSEVFSFWTEIVGSWRFGSLYVAAFLVILGRDHFLSSKIMRNGEFLLRGSGSDKP